MSQMHQVLSRLRASADAYRAEAAALAAQDRAGSATGITSTASVTVDGSGRMVAVQVSGDTVDPLQWAEDVQVAYRKALARRTPTIARALVPGVMTAPAPPAPDDAVTAPVRVVAGEALARGEHLAMELPDLTADGASEGVTASVNGMGLMVDLWVTDAELQSPPEAQEAHLMAAYETARAAIERLVSHKAGEQR